MLGSMDVYKISHSYKEGNRCAHWITKWIKEKGVDVLLFADFPLKLMPLAQTDAQGTYFIREW